MILKHPPVLDRPGKDVLAEEIDGEVLIPRGRDVLFHRQRLIAVGNDRELVLAVVNEVVIRRRGAEGLAIAKDHGAGRIGVDHVTALDAAAQAESAQGDSNKPQAVPHGFRLATMGPGTMLQDKRTDPYSDAAQGSQEQATALR